MDLNKKTVKELRDIAKERNLRGFWKLRKAELIDFIRQNTPQRTITIRPPPVPVKKIGGGGSLLDEPIPENEIPRGHREVLKPSKVNLLKAERSEANIDAATNFGKKEVENWDEWLKNAIPTPRVVDDELESFKRRMSFKRRINELYKKHANERKQYEIIKIGENSSKKFKSFFDKYKVKYNQPTEIDIEKVLLEIANRVIYQRGLKDGDKIRWILRHTKWNKPLSTKLMTIKGSLGKDLVNELASFVEYKEVPLSEVKIEIQSTKIPRGMGRLRVNKTTLNRKKSVITIKNDDSICLARAIVTAVANT